MPADPDPSNRIPPSEGPDSAHRQSYPAMTSGKSPRPSDPSTGTGGLAVSATIFGDQQTTSQTSTLLPTEESSYAPPATNTDCMMFDPDSSVASPTFNIDSEEATGASRLHHIHSLAMVHLSDSQQGESRSQAFISHPQQAAYQPHTAYAVKRERVMYFGPGTTAGSPTFNIRSPRASGTIEQVIPHRSEALTESFS
ncbi:uncharacterized protein EDB91DRAFT_1087179 [Suillus paluster]|uniref:uncharacterized protein n=1 Tax=Suillus paluster TaxID=48578 RepID=UPI001B86DB54|nr:uncharacterized protein EDB91DRAFT_1087179 [Suillus paluster]KAG1725261.1 hypothetical protein EDB91DRAFT_1087179 [Suillus paluster]